ncbi:hypothetical protein chiPu_0022344, partial [Chiloscyllium punctatum]|nr:hypothetical protein [Chiloscyllium punctatum]
MINRATKLGEELVGSRCRRFPFNEATKTLSHVAA